MNKKVQSTLHNCNKSVNKRLSDSDFMLPGREDLSQWDINKDETDIVGDNRLGTPSHKLEGDTNPTLDRNNARCDTLLLAEFALPNQTSGESIQGTVLKRAKLNNGCPKGSAHANLTLNTKQHDVRQVDRCKQELAHDETAKNIFSGADSEGRQCMVLDQIMDH